MNVEIKPKNLAGEVEIPASKSLTHRAIICASLSVGKSIINNPLYCDDTLMTINAVKSFGVKVDIFQNHIEIEGVKEFKYNEIFDVGDSASTLRFLLPILAVSNQAFSIKGSKRLMRRIDTIDLKKLIGLNIEIHDDYINVKGKLDIEAIELNDNLTSQLISGILFTLPITRSKFKWKNINNPYIDLTIEMLKHFGVNMIYGEDYVFVEEKYNHTEIKIESDFSGAAFFIVMSVLNQDIKIKGLNINSIQGDRAVIDYLQEMGVEFNFENEYLEVVENPIKGINKDLTLTPDLVPVMAAIAAVSQGITIFTGLEKLELKESDRLLSTCESLKTIGANIKIVNKNLVIDGKPFLDGGVTVSGYNDHRIIMSLVAVSSRVLKPFLITNAEYVNKSFPSFFDLFTTLGGKYESNLSK
jgi:3-phosphoshikimate 1-carboxyvinyltransferase